MLATIAIVILAAFPNCVRVLISANRMETRDIIIICMLSAACLMVILCKMSTDDIILTSTFRAGMSSLAVILGIVTLGTTFIDAHLTEIKDIAGDILQTYPMLLALVLFTCALLYSQGATTPLIIPLAVALNIPTRQFLHLMLPLREYSCFQRIQHHSPRWNLILPAQPVWAIIY